MPNQKNINTVKELKEKIAKSRSITFIDYQGLDVNSINEFRQQITDQNGETIIARNTLLKLALEEEGYKETSELKGPTAAVLSYEDPISPVKTIFDYAKKLDLPKVKFSFIEKVYTTEADTKVLSELPSKEELLAKVVGGLKSPLYGFVNVLGGTQRKFVTVLSRIAETKE